jgi:hypothetical protein
MRAVLVVVLGLVACSTKPNPNRCCTDTADCEAAGITEVTPCGDELVCRGHQCIAEVCTSANQCDLSAPFCVDGSCATACTADDQCPGNGGMSGDTHCVSGACVSCAANADCSSAAPVCDNGMCRGCAADAECASAACDTDSGSCLDAAQVVYVSSSGSATSMCSQTDRCTLHRAFSIIDASRPNIKLASGTYTTYETFTGTYALAVYGPGTLSGIAISSNGGALRLRDLTSTRGITCSAFSSVSATPTLDLKRVTLNVDTDTDGALGADQCNVTLSDVIINATGVGRSVTFEGIGGAGSSIVTADKLHMVGGDPAIYLANQSTMTITNAIFENQGSTSGVIQLGTSGTGGESGSISFSTFHNTTLKCPTGNTILSLSNNVILFEGAGAPTNTVSGSSCTHTHDMIKPQATSPGATNLLNSDPRFVNAAAGDFHLMNGSPAIDAADPAATLSTDYDGVTRPQGAGRDLGAFEYKP